jgi:hypothetical protein
LTVEVEEKSHTLKRGDIVNIPRRYNHKFYTENGCVFEEISTAYLQNDSVYDDESIKTIGWDIKITEFPLSLVLDVTNEEETANE